MRTLALQTATGEHGAIIQLIPMPTDSSPMELQNYFTKVGLDLTTELAEYIQARGRWARGNENPNSQSPVSPLLEGAALYLFVFRSEAADEGVHPQTVSFLTRCWLEVEGVRNLTDAAHAILSMLEERKVAEAAARAKSAEERAALFDTVRASTEQLVELLTEASEPVQRLSSAFSPFGGLIFGGLRAEKFYPDSPKKVKVNDRLPLIEVQHGWTADWYQSREPRPPLEQTAAVLLTVLGEAPGARMPLWNNLRALFESPPANMGPILNTLRDHLDGLDEALDKRANEFASTGVDAELAEKVFRTTKLWFHDVYKFQSPASIAAPSPKDGLPPSLLKSVFQIHGIDLMNRPGFAGDSKL